MKQHSGHWCKIGWGGVGFLLLMFSNLLTGPALAQTPTPTSTQTPPTERLFLPIILHLEPPSSLPFQLNSSLYMQSMSPSTAYALGCQVGRRDLNLPGTQSSLVILDYGQGWSEDGTIWGVWNFSWVFASTTEIGNSVREFGRGYYNCTGSDTTSQLTLAIGTNDYGSFGSESSDPAVRAVWASNHGRAWALLVAETQQWITNQGLGSQVKIAGANDIEQSWNKPIVARAWADAFQANNQGIYIYYNYGSCTNCPPRLNPALVPPNTWTLEDIWYVSYGLPAAWPVPEIYNNSGVNARQWAYLSYYAATQHGVPLFFPALMSQWQACLQVSNDPDCETLDNTPAESYTQLLSELAYWPQTRQDSISWVTDICWSGRSPACGQNLPGPSLALSALSPLPSGKPIASPPNNTKVAPKPVAAAEGINVPLSPTGTGLRAEAMPPISSQLFTPGNAWANWIDGVYTQIYAGSSPNDPQRGKLLIVKPMQPIEVQTIIGSGGLSIEGERDGLLWLRGANGQSFYFDLQKQSIIAP
jgi:hypothetical protein